MKLAFYFRKYHKWLALLVGVQALIWCVSGLYMTAVHIDWIHGDHLVKPAAPQILDGKSISPFDPALLPVDFNMQSLKLMTVNGVASYLVTGENSQLRFDAFRLEPIDELDAETVRQLALQIYAGAANIQSVEKLASYPREIGGKDTAVWQVQFDDWLTSTLYLDVDSGALIKKRSDLWRLFDFLWMLHIMDYESREDVNNTLLRIASSIGLLLTLTGLGLIFYRFKNAKPQKASFARLVKQVHAWLAIFVGLQLMIWMVSGLMFSLLSAKEVSGRYLLKPQSGVIAEILPLDLGAVVASTNQLVSVETAAVLNEPYYLATTIDGQFLLDVDQLQPVEINELLARKISSAQFAGAGELQSLDLETEATLETRKWTMPVWKASFNDSENSNLYISATTGQGYGVKTDSWRLFDFFWMLHIMDYERRDDFNNALVVFAVSMVSFIALTGVWLLFSVFSRADFNLWARLSRTNLTITNLNQPVNLPLRRSRKVYQELADAGYVLPSVCGGGGNCGLCKIKVVTDSIVSDADRQLLSKDELAQGFRLACQLVVKAPLAIELPDSVAQKYQSSEFD